MANDPSVVEFDHEMIIEEVPKPTVFIENGTHGDQLRYNTATGPLNRDSSGPMPSKTYTPTLSSMSTNNDALRINEDKNIPVLDTQLYVFSKNET